MMKIKIMSLALAAALLMACENQPKKVTTASGINVEFIKNADSRQMKQGDIVSFNMKYTTDSDSVIMDTSGKQPVSMPYDSAQWKAAGAIYEVFNMCTEGDSILFSIGAEELFVKTFRSQVPPGINKDSQIKFYLGLAKIQTEEEMRAEQKLLYKDRYEQQFTSRIEALKTNSAEQLKTDIEIIDKYLADNNIEAQIAESGMRYVITQEGSGENASAGDLVEAHYHGALLDGTKFDSSYDRGNPFSFTLKQGQVILGWDEGFSLLSKGAKATLYIPSSLAYGARSQGAVIKANSILKFDVELLDIK